MASRFVSIGLPVYNGGEQLRNAIETLLSQTHTDFELIISDNASTDEITKSLTEEYAKRDSRIRLFRQPMTLNATQNFLFVLGQARGDYFLLGGTRRYTIRQFHRGACTPIGSRPRSNPGNIDDPDFNNDSIRRKSHRFCRPCTQCRSMADVGFVFERLFGRLDLRIFRTSWLKVAAQDLTHYNFQSADMVWMFDVLLRGQVVGDAEATFFYNVIHGTRKRRTSRQRIAALSTEIYHLTRLVNLRLPPSVRCRAMGKVLQFLNRHRISRRNPIGTSVHLAKLAALGTWFGLESGVRKLFRLRPAA